MKPKGAKGRAMVRKLGRTKKTGGFNKIVKSVEARGGSESSAKKIAGKIFWNKVKKHQHG